MYWWCDKDGIIYKWMISEWGMQMNGIIPVVRWIERTGRRMDRLQRIPEFVSCGTSPSRWSSSRSKVSCTAGKELPSTARSSWTRAWATCSEKEVRSGYATSFCRGRGAGAAGAKSSPRRICLWLLSSRTATWPRRGAIRPVPRPVRQSRPASVCGPS